MINSSRNIDQIEQMHMELPERKSLLKLEDIEFRELKKITDSQHHIQCFMMWCAFWRSGQTNAERMPPKICLKDTVLMECQYFKCSVECLSLWFI